MVREWTKEVSNTKVSNYLQYNVVNIEKDVMNFGVSETRPVDSDFYINSNFFSDNATIGLVVINGKQRSSRVKGGGFFYVLNDLPHVSPLKCPSRTKFASQTILWGISNGDINHSLIKSKHAKQKRYRTLMGQNKDGNIIVISSNRIGFVTIKEILEFSLTLNVVDGILLDGGTSVDYKFSNDNGITTFSSVPHSLKNFLEIKHPTTYIYGNFK